MHWRSWLVIGPLLIAALSAWWGTDSEETLASKQRAEQARSFDSPTSERAGQTALAGMTARDPALIEPLIADADAPHEAQPEAALTQTVHTLMPAESVEHARTTAIGNAEKQADLASHNRLPQVVAAVQRQLEQQIAAWPISIGYPVHLTLDPTGLFDDPDGDLLSYRTTLNVPGLKLRNQDVLRINGTPKSSDQPAVLTIAARDDHHGDAENAWVSVRFPLPAMNVAGIKLAHPLEGGTLYRLETTDHFQGEYLDYEVVYCEAWRFESQQVYFAKSANKTQCPDDSQLQVIGQYDIVDNNLVVSSSLSALHHQQTWQMKKRYPSTHYPEINQFFTTVSSPSHVESYTLMRSKMAMEERINVDTGLHRNQVGFFDYLVPTPNGQYVVGLASNYIYDFRRDPNADYPWPDSDFNLQSRDMDLLCKNVQRYWAHSVVAGKGEYGDIISTTSPLRDAVFCDEAYHPDWQRTYTYYNLEYSPYDEFVEGEIYSYIMRPKPQYAGLLEEFKMNMRYHHPQTRAK